MKRRFLNSICFILHLWKRPIEMFYYWFSKRESCTKRVDGVMVCAPDVFGREFSETVSALEFLKENFPQQFLSLKENTDMILFTRSKRSVYRFSSYRNILTLDVHYIPQEPKLEVVRILLVASILIGKVKKNRIPSFRGNVSRLERACIRRQERLIRERGK